MMSKGKQPAADGLRAAAKPGPPGGGALAAGGRPPAYGSAERPLSEAERSLLRQLQNVKRELGTLVESLEAAQGGDTAEDGSEGPAAAADASGPASFSRGDGRAAAANGRGEQEAKENLGAAAQPGGKGTRLPKGQQKGTHRPPSLALQGPGSLHVAMVKERIKGLLSQRKKLELHLWALRDTSGVPGAPRSARSGEPPALRQAALGAASSAAGADAGPGAGPGAGRAQEWALGRDPPRSVPPRGPRGSGSGTAARDGSKGAGAHTDSDADVSRARSGSAAGKSEAAAVGEARSGDGGAVGLVEGDDLDLELGLDDQPAQLVETASQAISWAQLMGRERDKLIRTGAITPFDRLQGFAKSVVRGQAGPAPGSRQQGSGRVERASQSQGGQTSGTPAGNYGSAVNGAAANGGAAAVGGSAAGGSAGSTGDGELAASERRGLDILERARAEEEPRMRTKVLEPHEVPRERAVPEYEFGAMYRRSSAAAARKRKRGARGAGPGAGAGVGRPARAARPQPSKEWRKRRREEERREEVRDFLQSDEGSESGSKSGSGSESEEEYNPEGEDGEEEEEDAEGEANGETGSSGDENGRQGAPGRRRNGASQGRRARGSQGAAGRGGRGARARGDTEGAPGGSEEEDVILEGGLKIPGAVYRRLFEYQRTAVRWMWELHCQEVGGILGDEMGLGKTVQVAAFLGALHHSGLFKPSLIVCPVTLLRQWARELRKWCPALRPTILHSVVGKGAADGFGGGGDDNDEEEEEEEEELRGEGAAANGGEEGAAAKARRKEKRGRAFGARLRKATRHGGSVVLTTYEQIRTCQDWVLPVAWGYAILDEGHKIRNPDAGVTLACKQLRTPHRLLLTGCPIQNRLSELWSLLDFAYPGRLGTLPVFSAEFAQPISLGGYASASGIQVSTAYRCALYLRDIILPYLLRRVKKDVALHLPRKTEHVLLCRLTDYQRRLYRAFLGSEEVAQILDQRRNMLYGIDILRKVCNHPDLVTDADGWEGQDREWVQQAQHDARVAAASEGAPAGGTSGTGNGSGVRGSSGGASADGANGRGVGVGNGSGGRGSALSGGSALGRVSGVREGNGVGNGQGAVAGGSGVSGSGRSTGAGALGGGGRDKRSEGGAWRARDGEAKGHEARGSGAKDAGKGQGAPLATQGVAPVGQDQDTGRHDLRSGSRSPVPVLVKKEDDVEETFANGEGVRLGDGEARVGGRGEAEPGGGAQIEAGMVRKVEQGAGEGMEEGPELGACEVPEGAEGAEGERAERAESSEPAENAEGTERSERAESSEISERAVEGTERSERAERAERRKWDPLAADEEDEEFFFGDPRRSAKLQVAQKILEQWRAEGHKALVFCQTQQMLDILEALVARHAWVYRRMDGSTPVGQRSTLIDEFNSTRAATKEQAMQELEAARGAPEGGGGGGGGAILEWDDACMEEPIFVFLLTTRVGGLGTNLTAANRVLIFDPDWNPSTDLQARERAWRIGQQREVVIYRLLTKGTIEEKVYQRQIVKQQLSSRVLKDPRQRRLFKERDVREIFKLAEGDEDGGLPVCHPDNPLQGAVVVGGAGSGQGLVDGAEGRGRGREGEGGDRDGDGEGEEEAPDGGAAILKKLFDGKDIYAALDHGAVEKLAGDIPQWATARAAETAARAAQALRDSHAQRAHASVAEPTWTGRSGSAGIPTGPPRSRFGSTTVVRHRQTDSGGLVPGSSSSLSAAGAGACPLLGAQLASPGAAAGGTAGGAAAGVPRPGSGAGVGPSGAAVSSADLLSRLRERRLAASAGGGGFVGGALPAADLNLSFSEGGGHALGTPMEALGAPGVGQGGLEARVEREVVAMLGSAGEQGLSSLQIVTRLGAVLGERGQDAGAMRRVLERVAQRKQGLGAGEVRWVRGPQ